jgi:ABC-type taurine transport system substrate-binding protein
MDPLDENKKLPPLWHWVRDGIVDAALVGVPASLFAKQAGLKVIDIEPLPMIQFSSISTNLDFVQKHPDLVERFMKGLLEGIAFFKTRPDKAIEIIQRRYTKSGQMTREQAALTHHAVDSVLEAKMFPTMQAISNVYQEALRQDKEDAAKVNPMELWDLHHLRRLDDAGFIDSLYGNQRPTH